MEPITSLQNPHVKAAARLRDRRSRDRQQRIVIDGVREIGRALTGSVTLVEVFVAAELCASDSARALLAELAGRRVPRVDVSPAVFERLAYGERGEGIVAVAEPPVRSLADLKLPEPALVAVLAGVEKPGNVGAVLRSADAAGAIAR